MAFQEQGNKQCAIQSSDGNGDTANLRRSCTKYIDSARRGSSILFLVAQYRSCGDYAHSRGRARHQITDVQKAAVRQVPENNPKVSFLGAK